MVSRMARKQGHDSDSEEDEGEPCAPDMVEAPLPQGFKMPTIVPYDGSTDPTDHLSKFNRLRCTVYPRMPSVMYSDRKSVV